MWRRREKRSEKRGLVRERATERRIQRERRGDEGAMETVGAARAGRGARGGGGASGADAWVVLGPGWLKEKLRLAPGPIDISAPTLPPRRHVVELFRLEFLLLGMKRYVLRRPVGTRGMIRPSDREPFISFSFPSLSLYIYIYVPSLLPWCMRPEIKLEPTKNSLYSGY